MKTLQVCFAILWITGLCSGAYARVFTDSNGRTIEAEVAGVRGDKVRLTVNGKVAEWPIANLSEEDQKYIAKWELNSPPVKLILRVWERDGERPSSRPNTYSSSRPNSSRTPNGMGIQESKSDYIHYQLDIVNPSVFDATYVAAQYVAYIIKEDGGIAWKMGTFPIRMVAGKESRSVKTRSIEMLSTKTTSNVPSVSVNSNGTTNLTYKEKISRSKQSNGGIWVKVFDGAQLVAESKKVSKLVEDRALGWPMDPPKSPSEWPSPPPARK